LICVLRKKIETKKAFDRYVGFFVKVGSSGRDLYIELADVGISTWLN
jgi:hypothetical protein